MTKTNPDWEQEPNITGAPGPYLTVPQYRLLVRLSNSYQHVRPTSLLAKRLVKLGLAQWGKSFHGGHQRTVLCITPAGRERI